MTPKPDPLHPPTGPRAGTGQEPTVIEAGEGRGDRPTGVGRCALSEADAQLVGDALGFLWVTAPARREEIAEMASRTGLSVIVDA